MSHRHVERKSGGYVLSRPTRRKNSREPKQSWNKIGRLSTYLLRGVSKLKIKEFPIITTVGMNSTYIGETTLQISSENG